MKILNFGYSLKNPHGHADYLIACDMLDGGFRIFKNNEHHWHILPGWTMAWGPQIITIDGQEYIYFCDTSGKEPFWETMRIFRLPVSLDDKKHGYLESIKIFGQKHGIIDPFLFEHGDWWYLFHARLINEDTRRWWDIAYSVSKNPAGPFHGCQYMGLDDPAYAARVENIDEAPKIISIAGHLHIFWSTEDSGIDGTSHLGHLKSIGTHSDGWVEWWVDPIHGIESDDRSMPLCTAPCWYRDQLYVTTREKNYTGSRDKFRIGILNL